MFFRSNQRENSRRPVGESWEPISQVGGLGCHRTSNGHGLDCLAWLGERRRLPGIECFLLWKNLKFQTFSFESCNFQCVEYRFAKYCWFESCKIKILFTKFYRPVRPVRARLRLAGMWVRRAMEGRISWDRVIPVFRRLEPRFCVRSSIPDSRPTLLRLSFRLPPKSGYRK